VKNPVLHAYSAKIDKIWYCVIINTNGFLASSQFSLNSREEAVNKACYRFRQGEIIDRRATDERAKRIIRALSDIFKGKQPLTFPPLIMDGLSEFSRKTLNAVRKIPKGYVSTYGDIACAVGVPRGGRAVGNVMAENPLVLVIPCHRVVKSNLTVGGYTNNSGVKTRLLKREGVEFQYAKVKEKCIYKFNNQSIPKG
jgi:methylated-DNA-[protein]-cysteine S-methyltransferase